MAIITSSNHVSFIILKESKTLKDRRTFILYTRMIPRSNEKANFTTITI